MNGLRCEVILRAGAAGGTVTLYGVRTRQGWLFSRNMISVGTAHAKDPACTPSLEPSPDVVDTWPEALALIEQHQWHRLYPLHVHPDFRRQVYEAVAAHYHLIKGREPYQLSNWRKLCGVGHDLLA